MRLRLTPMGKVPGSVMELLVNGLPGLLPVQPVVTPVPDDAPEGPIGSAALVDAMLEVTPHGSAPRLVITERELHDAAGMPVFGEATVDGPVALVSVGALRAGSSGSLAHRVLASAVHELGHLAGAEHCADPECVMYPSRSLAETDAKGPAPCRRCEARIRTFFAGDA